MSNVDGINYSKQSEELAQALDRFAEGARLAAEQWERGLERLASRYPSPRRHTD